MTLPPSILQILETADTDARVLPPTALYCEGWMLRLILHAAQGGIPCLPVPFAAGSRWFSEPSLYTAFAATSRSDQHAEKHTRADGVVGHFAFKPGTKTGLVLQEGATQFVVIEAKISSGLSAGVTNANTFNQATRNVACIAHALADAGLSPQKVACGFWIIAPESTIAKGAFAPALDRNNLLLGINERIQRYNGDRRAALEGWFDQWVKPTIASVELGCWSWEQSVRAIEQADLALGEQIRDFYTKTLRFSAAARQGNGSGHY